MTCNMKENREKHRKMIIKRQLLFHMVEQSILYTTSCQEKSRKKNYSIEIQNLNRFIKTRQNGLRKYKFKKKDSKIFDFLPKHGVSAP